MLTLPPQFISSVCNAPGFDELAFTEAHQTVSPTSIRVNPFKATQLNFNTSEKVLWNDKGFYLSERPNFTHDILFQAGCYYVQEAGSMFIEHALKSCINFEEKLSVFDVCASPGGKSTLLNSLLNTESFIVANEVVKQRSDVLAQNLTKWGTNNVIVTNNDPTAFSEIEQAFDIVVVDAPCSGSGLFRKQHDAVNEWSVDNVNLCCQRQKRILSDVIATLKNGGTLLYSTCSYSSEENEQIVDWLISEFQMQSVKVPIEQNWGIVETQSHNHKGYGYRFYPHKTKSEGFFCAVFQKPGESTTSNKKSKREAFSDIKTNEKQVFENWVKDAEQQTIVKFKDDFLLINSLVLDFINRYPNLYYKKVGTNLGSVIKKELVPHHDLALSIHRSQNIKNIECSNDEALKFLKKELQKIEGNKGWCLMTHKGYGIGWIKHLGNRINNYLPNEFRVLK